MAIFPGNISARKPQRPASLGDTSSRGRSITGRRRDRRAAGATVARRPDPGGLAHASSTVTFGAHGELTGSFARASAPCAGYPPLHYPPPLAAGLRALPLPLRLARAGSALSMSVPGALHWIVASRRRRVRRRRVWWACLPVARRLGICRSPARWPAGRPGRRGPRAKNHRAAVCTAAQHLPCYEPAVDPR